MERQEAVERTARALASGGWDNLSDSELRLMKDDEDFRVAVVDRSDEIREEERRKKIEQK